jgi:hypothetical protein
MNAILFRDTIINLDHVVKVRFIENSPDVSHDDRCSIIFTTDPGSPLEIYGEDARAIYKRIAAAMGVSLDT